MKTDFVLSNPHRRYNPLKDEWVLVSPNRTKRPWQGKQEELNTGLNPQYDASCYICPGNKRANGQINPKYPETFVFPNDFPALLENKNPQKSSSGSTLKFKEVSGECRVISFSPRHDLTLANMEIADLKKILKTWIREFKDLSKNYNWVQIFENKGELMGCSNPHPHGQIWASNFIPNEIYKEDVEQHKYFSEKSSNLLLDYILEEKKSAQRIILENNNWTVLVPYWATWPYETMLLPKTHKPSFAPLTEIEMEDLAKIMKQQLSIYDRLFSTSMPYSMGWHYSPLNVENNRHWQLHAHYYPPLLRSATVKKFMVGYEMLAEAQRDITPEEAAEKLISLI